MRYLERRPGGGGVETTSTDGTSNDSNGGVKFMASHTFSKSYSSGITFEWDEFNGFLHTPPTMSTNITGDGGVEIFGNCKCGSCKYSPVLASM